MSQSVDSSADLGAGMKAQPQKEHEWLHRLVGEWTFESEAPAGPGQPPTKLRGSERVRSLGGLWVLAESEGEMPGGGHGSSVMTLGYDPDGKRFVGTWVGSMMTHLWRYEGQLDAAGRRLTLDSEGPGMSGEGMAKYQDTIELTGEDTRTLTARVQGEDGSWQQMMTVAYRRKA